MKQIFKDLIMPKILTSTLLFALMIATISCKKTTNEIIKEPESSPIVFSYEVTCDYCNISYTDENNHTKTVNNNSGKWSYKIDKKITFNLILDVKTVLSSYQSIQTYILKDGEVVYGNLGYNRAEISYNINSGNGVSSFGSYIPSNPTGGAGSGGTTAPISSLCGAKNKTGGYCKRLVVGGGRCWQHR